MPAGRYTVTVTAKTGPGLSVTAMVLQNVTNINFAPVQGTVSITQDDPPFTRIFQYSDVATVTTTPASRTMTIST